MSTTYGLIRVAFCFIVASAEVLYSGLLWNAPDCRFASTWLLLCGLITYLCMILHVDFIERTSSAPVAVARLYVFLCNYYIAPVGIVLAFWNQDKCNLYGSELFLLCDIFVRAILAVVTINEEMAVALQRIQTETIRDEQV